jgi:2-polyprenyl-6-methoxyphenol hydroxylase-like FAD-dependent oxidoreductase
VSGYDAIVVGGRCGGSMLALAMANAGAKVLVIDKDELGSDTLSTHFVFPNTIARLDQLGVLGRLEQRHELRPVMYGARILGREVAGTFTPIEGHDRALGITRPTLDRALGEAAIDAGAEMRFGVKVTGVAGSGTDGDPVSGVELEDGSRVEAPWVIGADGRASFVARALELDKRERMSADISMLFAYFRGLPDADHFWLDVDERRGVNWMPCEDGIDLLVAFGHPDFSHGDAETRRRRLLGTLHDFPDVFYPGALDDAEMISEVRVVPEPMLHGFFRQAAGPGWALVGDAGHFKHPATAQGISDAIEQALYVADALGGADPDLSGYEAWRDQRAAGHYDWSFRFGSMPKTETAGPIFDGVSADPAIGQQFRDTLSRTADPRDLFTPQRLEHWFAASAAG